MSWLAFQFGKLFIFFFNLCGRLDYDMAFGLLEAMWKAVEHNKSMWETQENYRKAVDGT